MRALARGGASSARAARAPRTRRAPPRRLAAARPRAASSGDDAAESGWRTLGGTTASSREDSGWIAVQDEPSVSSPEEDYERDFSGRVVYRPRGYYYDAVRASDAGERVKVDVGVVDKRRARTFCIAKRLAGGSDLVEVTMERPLGIVFERDTEGRVRVADFVDGSKAGRAAAVDRLQGLNAIGAAAPRRGDVLRAFTASTLSFGPRAQLLGDLSGTKRAVVLFGADDQPWGKVSSSLSSGLVRDGPVTLILERHRDAEMQKAWTPEPAEARGVRGDASRSGGGTRRSGAGGRGPSGATAAETSGGERKRVARTSLDLGGVPDPINAAAAVAGLSFLLLVFTGFNP